MTSDSKSTFDIQKEVEKSRAKLASTLERIEEKFSPGAMFDDAIGYVRESETLESVGEFGQRVGRTVKENPLPVAAAAAGIGWLAWSVARSNNSQGRSRGGYPYYPDVDFPDRGEDYDDPYRSYRDDSLTGRAERAVRGGASAVEHASSAAGAKARHAAHGVQDRMHAAGDGLRHGAQRARDGASQAGRQVRKTYDTQLAERPLLLAGLALGLGAVLGSALPRTSKEDEYIGEHSDSVKARAREIARAQMLYAEEVAGHAYRAAREEARHQGLSVEGAKAGAKAAGDAARDKLDAVKDAAVDGASEPDTPKPNGRMASGSASTGTASTPNA